GKEVWELLDKLARVDDSPFVFPGAKEARDESGNVVKPAQPLKEIRRVWEAVRHAAGLETVRLHDLRHSHASVGAGDFGLSLRTIGALLGHTEVATTQRYAHIANDPLKRAADAVAARVAGLLAAGGREAERDAKVLPLVKRA
ncbi:MAG TPA: tyrosine-type recombinase/integrase, partial [Gemmatimonadaceae bacterium]